MPAKRGKPAKPGKRGRVERRKSSPVIASRYTAIIEGVDLITNKRVRHSLWDTVKRDTMRAGKRYASMCLERTAIVELRAGDEDGGILERVSMDPHGERGYRWRSTFET